jgi:hypothetical protein
VGHSTETLIAAPSALPADRMMYPRHGGREPVDALGLFTLMPAPTILNHRIRSMIPTYIEVYWDKVHSMYPIIHKPTFENPTNMSEEHLEILQCVMAAVATQFLEHEEHRSNGHQLHTYAMDKAKIVRAKMKTKHIHHERRVIADTYSLVYRLWQSRMAVPDYAGHSSRRILCSLPGKE